MATAPRLSVEPIARQPLPHGLFSVLPFRDTTDDHWQNGVEWEALPCAPIGGLGESVCGPYDEEEEAEGNQIGLPKQIETGAAIPGEASEFTVYADYLCNPVGRTIEYANARAAERLLAREESRVEQALWTGDLGNLPNLTDAVPVTVTAGTSDADLLGVLEQEAARSYGAVGVIHMTRALASRLVKTANLTVTGQRLTTPLGTPVVAGAGYGGADGNDWQVAYATPALVAYRSEVFAPSSIPGDLLDRSTNTLAGLAERSYVIGWDDCGVLSTDFAAAD